MDWYAVGVIVCCVLSSIGVGMIVGVHMKHRDEVAEERGPNPRFDRYAAFEEER